MSEANVFDSFFNPQTPFTALDLSDRSVKIARAEQGKRARKLIGVASGEIPPGVVVQGRVQDSAGLAKAIVSVLRSSAAKKLVAPAAVMTLPEEHCFIRVVRVPVLSLRELDAAIRWEAEAAIPLPAQDAVISWQVIGKAPTGDHIDVVVGGVPRDLAESYVDALRRVPILPVAFEPESFAIARALLKPEDRDAVMIIDLGREHTGVIIAYDRVVRVTANIPIAARVFTERIAEAGKVPLEQAEKLKREYGIGSEGQGARNREILSPVLQDLTSQIQQFFGFFETHGHLDIVRSDKVASSTPAQAPTITRVILAGGDALLKGLPEYLAQAFHVPVVVGDSFKNLQRIPLRLERHPLFATVVGLALYQLDISSL